MQSILRKQYTEWKRILASQYSDEVNIQNIYKEL